MKATSLILGFTTGVSFSDFSTCHLVIWYFVFFFSLGERATEFGFAVLYLLVQVDGEFVDDIILLWPEQIRFDGMQIAIKDIHVSFS